MYCGQTVGWIKMPLGTQVGLSPDHIVLHGDPAPTMESGTSAPLFGPVCCGTVPHVSKKLSSCSPLHGSTILSHTQTRICTTTTHSFIALGIICAWSYAPRHSAPLVNPCINVSTAPCTHPPSSPTEFHRALDSVRKLIICHLPAIT